MDSVISDKEKIFTLADRYLAGYFSYHPEEASFYGLPGAAYDRFMDNSPQGLQDWHTLEDSMFAELSQISPAQPFGSSEWVVYGFVREALEASRAMRIVHEELWPVNQMFGWQNIAPMLLSAQPMHTSQDRENAFARWNTFPQYIKNELNNLREGIKRGYSTPQRNVQFVIEQLEKILSLPLDESPFYLPLKQNPDQKLKESWITLVQDKINPAIRDYCGYLKVDYLPKARLEMALIRHPDGEQAYQACIRKETTLSTTAAEVFARGRQAVALNKARRNRLGQDLLGISDERALLERLETAPDNHFSSREEMHAFCEETLARARQSLGGWFQKLPKADVVIKTIPVHEEETASSNYRPAPDDGSRPAVYNLNLFQHEKHMRGSLETEVVHEAYPGHHTQISISQEREQTHPITRFIMNGAYIEGWARYAESLAGEMGIYKTPYAMIGRLGWPARGMVVDPGLHVFGWTREQAVQYILEAGSMSPEVANSLVDRIAIMPGQLTSYDSGGLEFFALRKQAEETLGNRFNIKEFHSKLLEDGSITLTMLRAKIENWIAEKQKTA